MSDTIKPEKPPVAREPVAQAERHHCIDTLRGFALLGILLMNIQSFAMIGQAYMNPTNAPMDGVNYWIWYFGYLFFDTKMMSIFSMLFGVGIALMADRQLKKNLKPASLHYRRMLWLLLIGLIHAHFIWYGDILVCYSMCGMIVYLFRRLPVWALIPLGLVTLSVASALSMLSGLSMEYWPEETVKEMQSSWVASDEVRQEEIERHRGSYFGLLPYRMLLALTMETFMFLFLFGWRAGGLMLIGIALYKMKVVTGERSTKYYAGMASLAIIGATIIIIGINANESRGWPMDYSFFLGNQFNYWGSIFMALSYVGIWMLICKTNVVPWLTKSLAAVGQMALTNYLMHSIICTFIFYGHGLGMYERMDRVGQLAVVVSIWLFQMIVSPIWLKYFKFGPAEWLWRSLSYWKRQPMRR